MEEKSSHLLESIHTLFMRNGIKSMTMDDISRSLSISKKTLYIYFKDKGDLVSQVMEYYLESEKKAMEEINLLGLNAVDEMFEISKHVSEQVKDIHPSIHYDLEKYYPEAWQIFMSHKLQFIYSCVQENMKKGVSEGFYRDCLNIPIVAKIYISRIDKIFDPLLFPVSEFKFSDVVLEMMRYHIRGIASEKGLKYIKKKIKNSN